MKKKTTEQFIIEAEGIHTIEIDGVMQPLYDYSETDYTGVNKKVKIKCKEHGVFLQTPNNHLHGGNGCRKCSFKRLHKNNTLTTELFIEKANIVFSHLDEPYDYSRSHYSCNYKKVEIGCKEHGYFWQTPHNHIHSNSRHHCPVCASISGIAKKSLSPEEMLKRVKETHGDFYDYSESEFISIRTKVKIRCRKHGYFWQTPVNHYSGNGCVKCSYERSACAYHDEPTMLYYLRITDYDATDYWKIGITIQEIYERFSKEEMAHIEVLWTKQYDTGFKAWKVEQYILDRFLDDRPFKEIEVLKGGYTEIFDRDVLGKTIAKLS